MRLAPQNKLRPMHALENKAVQRVPEREPVMQTAIPHIHVKKRLDGSSMLLCTHCGGQLELDYSTGGMKSRLYAFCDEHEECKAQQMEVAS